jgi:hypothetical protein
MGTIYLVDAHSTVLGTSRIRDTVNLQSGSLNLRGSFPVNVPFDVPVDGVPSDLTDLVSKKYTGLLSLYPGYTTILYDEQIDGIGWDEATSITLGNGIGGFFIGERQTTGVVPVGSSSDGLLATDLHVLTSTPTSCVVRYEAFRYGLTDPISGVAARTYQETIDSNFQVYVTFNNDPDPSAWLLVTNGAMLTIPLVNQGNQFRLSLFNETTQKTWLGSWALIY